MNFTIGTPSTPLAEGPDLLLRLVDANIHALRLPRETVTALREATAKGEIIRLADGNPALSLDGTILGAPTDAKSEARVLDELSEQWDGVILVFGLGVGHVLRDLRARTQARLVVFEPDPGLLRTVLESGPTDLGNIVIVTDLRDLQMVWPNVALDKAFAKMILTPGYDRKYPRELEEVTKCLHMLVEDIELIENTRALRYRNWLDHVFQNIPLLADSTPILALKDKYNDVPAFIIGAGPSLDQNAAILAEAKLHGIVFAVDTSARVLENRGIEPHVLVSLEANDHSKDLGALKCIDTVVRAYSLTAHPDTIRVGKGPLLPFHEALEPFLPLNDLLGANGLAVGGSVSTVAFTLALQLGCNPIVLVGQDLAYTGEKTHASGTMLSGTKMVIDTKNKMIRYEYPPEVVAMREKTLGPAQSADGLVEAEAWGGEGVVPTTSTWSAYRLWFELASDSLKREKPELRLVNATEGGARIRGFEEMRLADVVASCERRDLSSESIAALAASERGPLTPSEIARWSRRNALRARSVHRIAAKLERHARLALTQVRTSEPAKVRKAFSQLEKIEGKCRELCGRQPLLQAWAYAQMHSVTASGRETLQSREGDSRADAEWGLKAEQEFAKVLRIAATELESALSAIATTMTNRASTNTTNGK